MSSLLAHDNVGACDNDCDNVILMTTMMMKRGGAGAWQEEWKMKARHLTKAQGPKVLLHSQNTELCAQRTRQYT